MLTVLLTTYNSAKYLHDSIGSILNQTFKDYEFLIIDDGSEDHTEQLVKSYSDTRIRYIKISHSGRSKALNIGLQKAKYDWIALMDADDIAHPKRLEKQFITGLKKNNVVLTSCVYFLNKRILFKIDVKNLKFPVDLILHQKFPNSVLYNKYFILENGGYNESLAVAEDYDLWLRVMSKTEFVVIDNVLMYIRYTPYSLSRKDIKYNDVIIYNIQKKYYADLKKNFGIIQKTKQNFYFGWREYFFGNSSKARNYWVKAGLNFFNPRVILAVIITFLPDSFKQNFKQSEIKLHLKYFISFLFGKNKTIETKFRKTINTINNLGKEF